jgi:hypothetical protein
MHPALTLANLIRLEIAARGIQHQQVQKAANIPKSSWARYLNGTIPFPPDAAGRALNTLDLHLGTGADPSVIRMDQQLLGRIITGATPETISPAASIDTLILDLEVEDDEHDELDHHLNYMTHERRGGWARGLRGWRHRARSSSGLAFAWEPYSQARSWLRLVLTKDRIPQWAEAAEIADRFAVRVRIARIDVALDYHGAHPAWILLRRHRATGYRRVESGSDGAITYNGGNRRSSLVVRVYDAAARHGFPAPCTRVEVEVKPRGGLALADLPRMANPFRTIEIDDLWAPRFNAHEAILTHGAQVFGTRHFMRALPPQDRAVLNGALTRARESALLLPPREVIDRRWLYLAEWVLINLRTDLERP